MKEKRRNNTKKRDQYTVVLEGLRSDFKLFGEGLGGLHGKVDKIDTRIGVVETELQIIKGEVALIRHNQITRDEFKLLESRVLRLEKLANS
ncbi:MAG TPA: hypothetical protein VJB98_03930 [Candidatus Paceibacterota bacterium]